VRTSSQIWLRSSVGSARSLDGDGLEVVDSEGVDLLRRCCSSVQPASIRLPIAAAPATQLMTVAVFIDDCVRHWNEALGQQ